MRPNVQTKPRRNGWQAVMAFDKGKLLLFYYPHICSGCASCQAGLHCPIGSSWLSLPSSFPSAFIHHPSAKPVLSARHQARGWDTETNWTPSLPSRISLRSVEPRHENQ